VYVCILQENEEKFEEKFGTLTPENVRYRSHIGRMGRIKTSKR